MDKEPKVSIILLNWNGIKDTKECIESLTKIDYSNWDLVVVDNGSSKSEQEELGKFLLTINNKSDIILNDTNKGYVVAENQAIKFILETKKDTKYILQLDNDTIVDKAFLGHMVELASNNKDTGLVGGKIYYYGEPNRLQFVGEKVNLWVGDVEGLINGIQRVLKKPTYDLGQYDWIREIDFMASWLTLVKRDVFEKVGLLDERYFFGWEDNDFCMRVQEAGYKIYYTPNAKIWHKYRSATALDGHLQYHGPRNRFRFMKDHASRGQYVFFVAYMLCVHFWLATAYYWLWVRKPKIWTRFVKGVWDGLRDRDI